MIPSHQVKPRCAAAAVALSVSLVFAGCSGTTQDELRTAGPPPTTADPDRTSEPSGPEVLEPDPTTPSESSTTLVEPPASPTGPDAPIPVPEEDGALSRNPNVRDGGLGSLCWSRWEVSRHIILYAVPDADLSRWSSEFRASLEIASKEMTTVASPPEVAQFADWLRDSIAEAIDVLGEASDAAPQVAFDAVNKVLAFEYAPEARAYVDLAGSSEGCARA